MLPITVGITLDAMMLLYCVMNEERCWREKNPLSLFPSTLFLVTILSFSELKLHFTVVWRQCKISFLEFLRWLSELI